MKQPHKHAALIKAWADGAEVEVYWNAVFVAQQFEAMLDAALGDDYE